MAYPVKVLFVKSPQWNKEITAVFPEEKYNHKFLTCYAHLGQHSGCDPTWVKEQEKAEPQDYQSLLEELTSIGYSVEVLN